MRERYQGGSLAGFIIIGVLLTLVLIGGLYGLNRYNAQQSKEVATDDKGASEEKPSDNSNKESEPQTDKSTEQSPSGSKDDEQASKPNESSSDNNASTNKQLPATGPADVAAAIVAIAALSFAGVHYAQSRAQRSR